MKRKNQQTTERKVNNTTSHEKRKIKQSTLPTDNKFHFITSVLDVLLLEW